MRWYPTDEVLEIVRRSPSPSDGWAALLKLSATRKRSALWRRLRTLPVDPDADAWHAAGWLGEQLAAPAVPRPVHGVYLGLDTLNMNGGAGSNVEIGLTARADTTGHDYDWVYRMQWYGTRHLVAGLVPMQAVYSEPEYERAHGFADYVLFLGYSGLVLRQACEHVRWRARAAVLWGFHDGDLFLLGRGGPRGFEVHCEPTGL